MLTIQKYVMVNSLEEAYELNQKRTNTIMGGTLWLKMSSRRVQTAIDLSRLGLDTIEETEETFAIGAMCSLRQLELNTALNSAFDGCLKECLRSIVGVQFRNSATVGGSVAGGYGFSDVITCLLVLDTYVELYKGGMVPLHEFYERKKDNDILVRIHIKKSSRRVCYLSQRNTATDFPVITCAMAAEGNRLYTAVGARPARAQQYCCTAEENHTASELASHIADQYRYGSNMRAGGEYRRRLAEIYIRRGLLVLTGGGTDADQSVD